MKILIAMIIWGGSLTVFGQQEWQKQIEKIRPLVTTEADVEKLLGKPAKQYSNNAEYETKDGIFTISYSEGNCKEDIVAKYNVGRETVIEYDFRPRRKIKFSTLGINTSGWPTSKSGDIWPPTITYDDLVNGVSYDVNSNRLIWVQVYPADSLSHLAC